MNDLFCPNCRMRLNPGTRFCPNCGCAQPMSGPTPGPMPGPMPQQPYYSAPVYIQPDAPSAGYTVLGFFLPVVGLILYLVWKDTTPLRAKSAGKGALAGAITAVGLSILMFILMAVIVAGTVSYF